MASVPLFGSEMLRPKYSYLLKWGSSERLSLIHISMFHETRFTSRYPISWPAALLFRFSMTNQFGAVGYEQIVRVAHREIPL